MFDTIAARLRQGRRPLPDPANPPPLPDRFRGRPLVDAGACNAACNACAEACPYDAIVHAPERSGAPVSIDLGRCLFCGECAEACAPGALRFTGEHRMATRTREALVTGGAEAYRLAEALETRMRRLFGRSLRLRQVSAGGCNACEADLNVLTTIAWDLGRFGVQFVASPRHADGILVTGPVTRNMELALRKTWEAVPEPRLAIAVGACAIGGGPYQGHPEALDGAGALVPIDLYIPGCPPHPLTILDGLVRLLGRLE